VCDGGRDRAGNRERGLEQGIEQGKEEGAKEKQLEIAKSLLDILDIKTIALKTGLSEEEIERVKNEEY
jgi:predicted transposase/invertase (TIGR01784 family)